MSEHVSERVTRVEIQVRSAPAAAARQARDARRVSHALGHAFRLALRHVFGHDRRGMHAEKFRVPDCGGPTQEYRAGKDDFPDLLRANVRSNVRSNLL